MTIHCPRAALKELKSGVAIGRNGQYMRHEKPMEFWMTIVATGLAGVLGLFFFVFGVSALFSGGTTIAEVFR